jgi:2-polyprenyl-6-methoxyphenol hydroxylase-like FAD-dependent oxidoreductase
MNLILKTGLLALSIVLTGCATPAQSTGTYSGDAKAALIETANSMRSFVRKSLTKPMPAWEQAPGGAAIVVERNTPPEPAARAAASAAVTTSVVPASSGVEVYAVAPADTATRDVSLTQEELNLKNPAHGGAGK